MSSLPINAVIIVAAGRGERVGVGQGPKQYRHLAGRPLLAHTLDAFLDHPDIHKVVVCIHPDDEQLYAKATTDTPKLLDPVHGGATRQASVLAGLKALGKLEPANVLIHDAARPFITQDVISRVLEGLTAHPAILPAVSVADTLKQASDDGTVIKTVPREYLFAAQTPQGFHFATILDAHIQARVDSESDFTDDAALAEWARIPVKIVDGDVNNSKITTKNDLEEADRRMTSTMPAALPDVRTGHGYDVHQLVDGKSIRLCGIDIPHNKKLSGHSDADVGLHALTDALLASIGDGDIGSHFPPSDVTWKGADSHQFLAHAAKLVREAHGTITHCDVTLVCEEPKIGPHRDAMRAAIAGIVDIDVSRVSVKATTNERIGFIGREEGIASIATATVVITPQ